MMNLYIATLQIRSALGTPLTADTLWGHVAWGIRRRSGVDTLSEWIEEHDNSEPPLVLSDPFPQGYLPRPHLPATSFVKQAKKAEAAKAKRLGKLRWLPVEGFHSICGSVSPSSVQQWIRTADTNPLYPRDWMTESTRIRIGVNRFTGGTETMEGGALFESREWMAERGQALDIWVASSKGPEQVKEWLTWGIEGGYGRDASAGLGNLACTQVVPATLPTIANANAAMILGTWVPKTSEPCSGFVNLVTKQGRVGGDYSTAGGEKRKFPIRFIASGSTLITTSTKIVGGRLVRNIHPELSQIVFPGLAIWLPMALAPEVMAEIVSDRNSGVTAS